MQSLCMWNMSKTKVRNPTRSNPSHHPFGEDRWQNLVPVSWRRLWWSPRERQHPLHCELHFHPSWGNLCNITGFATETCISFKSHITPRNVNLQGLKGMVWMVSRARPAMWSSETRFLWSCKVFSFILHMCNYVEYKVTGRNIGQWLMAEVANDQTILRLMSPPRLAL